MLPPNNPNVDNPADLMFGDPPVHAARPSRWVAFAVLVVVPSLVEHHVHE